MSRMIATPAQRMAVENQKLRERAAAARSRSEAFPAAGQSAKVAHIENRIMRGVVVDVGRSIEEVHDAIDLHIRRLNEAEVKAASERQDALLAERGVETVAAKSGHRSRDGWAWLRAKANLTPAQRDTGDRWSWDYAETRTDGVKSCLSEGVHGAVATDPAERKHDAAKRINGARKHIRLATGDERLADLLDAVCGRGETVREMAGGDDRKALYLTAEARIALNMAAVSYGVLRVAA